MFMYALAFAIVMLWGPRAFRVVYMYAFWPRVRSSESGQYISAEPALTSGLAQGDVAYIHKRFKDYLVTKEHPQGAAAILRVAAREDDGLMGKFQLDRDSVSAYVSDKQKLSISATRFVRLCTDPEPSAKNPPRSGEGSTLRERLESIGLPLKLAGPPFSLAWWWPPPQAELKRLSVYEARLQTQVDHHPRGSVYYVLLDERTGVGYLLAY